MCRLQLVSQLLTMSLIISCQTPTKTPSPLPLSRARTHTLTNLGVHISPSSLFCCLGDPTTRTPQRTQQWQPNSEPNSENMKSVYLRGVSHSLSYAWFVWWPGRQVPDVHADVPWRVHPRHRGGGGWAGVGWGQHDFRGACVWMQRCPDSHGGQRLGGEGPLKFECFFIIFSAFL